MYLIIICQNRPTNYVIMIKHIISHTHTHTLFSTRSCAHLIRQKVFFVGCEHDSIIDTCFHKLKYLRKETKSQNIGVFWFPEISISRIVIFNKFNNEWKYSSIYRYTQLLGVNSIFWIIDWRLFCKIN